MPMRTPAGTRLGSGSPTADIEQATSPTTPVVAILCAAAMAAWEVYHVVTGAVGVAGGGGAAGGAVVGEDVPWRVALGCGVPDFGTLAVGGVADGRIGFGLGFRVAAGAVRRGVGVHVGLGVGSGSRVWAESDGAVVAGADATGLADFGDFPGPEKSTLKASAIPATGIATHKATHGQRGRCGGRRRRVNARAASGSLALAPRASRRGD